MFNEYVAKAMKKAEYEPIEDGTYFGMIPGFDGLWGNGKTVEECREDLIGALEDWLVLGLWLNHTNIPRLGKLDLIPRKSRLAQENESPSPARTRKAS